MCTNTIYDIIRDSDGRFVLDTYEKVINYILYTSSEEEINLSNCVLIPSETNKLFDICELFIYAKKIGKNLDIGINESDDEKHKPIVTKRLICNNSIFRKTIFSNTIFEKHVSFEASTLEELHFNHTSFTGGLSITQCSLLGYLSFQGVQANSLYIHNTTFKGTFIDFTSSKLNSISILSSSFNYCERFKEELIKTPNIINLDLSFANALLGDVAIIDVKSELYISFLGSKICRKIEIYDSIFENGIIFENTKIAGISSILKNEVSTNKKAKTNVVLTGSTIKSDFSIIGFSSEYIIANNCVIDKSGRLSIFNTNTNYIEFVRASIYGELNISHINTNANNDCTIDMECAINLGYINVRLNKITVANFDTAKILRLASQTLNNSIEVTALKAKEHKLFLKENKLKFTYTSIADHLLLWLNKVSNNFGTNWISGCVFCVCVSIIFVTIMNIALGEYSFCLNPKEWFFISNAFWIKIFEFIWLPDLDSFNKLLANQKCNVLAIISFIIGKSLIAYGIFQTIISFRKYSNR